MIGMSSVPIWGEGMYSPYTDIISAEIPTSIFYSHPTDATDPNYADTPDPSGWGLPFYDDDGKPLILGTKGGDRQTKVIGKVKEAWHTQSQPGGQVYGNVDWRGPQADPESGIRVNISWNGPQARYFPDDKFEYGLDNTYEVYYRGKVIAVLPRPVLGAAAKLEEDPDTKEVRWMLYVIGKDGSADILYKYRMHATGWSNSALDSGIRRNLQDPYHVTDNPLGYIVLYRLPRQSKQGTPGHEIDDEALVARTPWFFNESCTKAVCMREVTSTYADVNGVSYSEVGLAKYTMSLDTITTFSYDGALPRMIWREKHDYVRYLDANNGNATIWNLYPYYRDNATYDITVRHPYIRFKLEQEVQAAGYQTVAVDFDGDTLVVANMRAQNYRTQKQGYSQGVDCNADYAPLPLPDSCTTEPENFNEVCGRQPGTLFEYLNGSGSSWIGGYNVYTLQFTNSGGAHKFLVQEDVYGDGPDDGGVEDHIFDYHGYTSRFMHFADLRHPFLFVYTEIKADEWISPTETSTQIFHKEGYSLDSPDPIYTYNRILVNKVTQGSAVGYKWTANDPDTTPIVGGPAWPLSTDTQYVHSEDGGITYYYTTEFINAGWSDGVDLRSSDASVLIPPYSAFYTVDSILPHNPWHSWTTFFSNTYDDVILGATLHTNLVSGSMAKSGDDWVFSYRVPDIYTGDPTDTVINIINGVDAIAELSIPIKALYPLGVV